MLHDDEPDFLGTDPEVELEGHDVTVVHTYSEAVALTRDISGGIPAFDVVLADMFAPWSPEFPSEMGAAGIFFIMHGEFNLIRGLGVFAPSDFDGVSTFDFDQYFSIVVDRDCVTPSGKRDFRRLLDLVVADIERLAKSA